MNESILASECLKLVISGSKVVASILLQVLGNCLSEADVSVETSADSRAALSNLVNILKRLDNTFLALFELVNVGAEFLTKRQRCGILCVGTTNFADVSKFIALSSQSFSQADKLWQEAFISFHDGCNVHD